MSLDARAIRSSYLPGSGFRTPALIFAAGIGIGVFVWFLASSLQPMVHPDRPIEYVFLGASPLLLGAVAVPSIILLALGHRRLMRAIPVDRAVGSADSYLVPLALLGVAPAAGLVLLPDAAPRLSVLTYLLVDLRAWWALALVGTAIVRLDRLRGWPLWIRMRRTFGRAEGDPQFRREAALFLLLLSFSLLSARYLRFTSVLHGDEPKYLRYCENFYQGRGFEVGNVQPVEELTLAYRPPIARNLQLFATGVREDVALLVEDARRFFGGDFGMRFNRAQFVEGWFLHGRNGGFYQVHNPGLSFVLFPAYFIDRHFFATSAGYQDVFPTLLPATNFLILLIWSIWSVVLYRLFRAYSGRDGLAWILAATAMLTMPVAAFGFQIYPEALGGLIVAGAFLWLMFREPDTTPLMLAVFWGAAVAFLPWLHVRFILMSLVLGAWAVFTLRRRRFAFAGGYAVVFAALCLYAYHLTGSFRPDAMYEAEGGASPWRLRDALEAMAAYPLDRIWGFLPHAPVYLFALPGWLLAMRRSPRVALLAALLIASLVVPSAGHGFTAAGATPLRHLVAVVPLAMIALASTLIAYGHRRWVQVAFMVLLVISLDASISYNLHHQKETGRMIDAAVSGWAPNLLFPWTHAQPWRHWTGTFALFLIWVGVLVALVLLPLLRRGETGARATVELPHLLAGAVVFLALATGATALGGEWIRADYAVPLRDARNASIDFAAGLDRCRICYSSLRGEIGRGEVAVGVEHDFDFYALNNDVRAGEEVVFHASAATQEGSGWGTLSIDFGDGASARVELLDRTEVRHVYRSTGEHDATARFTPFGSTPLQRSAAIGVRSAVVDLDELPDVPAQVREATLRGAISEVRLGPQGFVVDLRDGGAAESIWLFAWSPDGWRTLERSEYSSIPAGTWIAVTAMSDGASYRTPPVVVRQPASELTIGAPVVLFPERGPASGN
jgi:hypothetical protein